ncbi:hypothetical protein ACFRCW_36840 [Streptomyces sp. NPDC056653]|uniref:hypothetical protein n=1 Tax=Streptomyces sp. NPDC056653 TaxID=3345894 RepID=UPI0036AF39FB
MSMEGLARLITLAAQRRGMIRHPGRDRIYKWETRHATPCDGHPPPPGSRALKPA